MRAMFRSLLPMFGFGVLTLVGCGGGTTQTTLGGVDGSAEVGALSPSDATKVCNSVESDFSPTQLCTLVGVLAEVLGQDCATVQQACTQAPPPDCSMASTVFVGCTATVAQVTECLNDFTGVAGGLTCSSSVSDVQSTVSSIIQPCGPLFSCEGAAALLPGLML
jgi:hypothetical protein